MPYAEVNGVRLFYTDDGEGPFTLLLMHGLSADSQDWSWVIPRLGPKYRIIACDFRGHGHSSLADTYRLQDFVDDMASLVEQTGAKDVIPVGHSHGGAVAAVMAVEHPDLVPAVVEVDPAYALPDWLVGFWEAGRAAWHAHPDDSKAFENAVPMPPPFPATPEFLTTWNYRRMQAMPMDVRWRAYEGLADDPRGIFQLTPAAEAYLRRRLCPVLSFHTLPGRAVWEQALFQHPSSHAVEWEGSGHAIHIERPRELAHLIATWLDRVGAQPTPMAASKTANDGSAR